MMYRMFFVALLTLMFVGGAKDARGEKWEQLLQKLYPAAKQEGEVILNTSRIEEVGGKEGVEKFQKRFPGIKVTRTTMSASHVPPRVIAETRAGRVTIDAFRGGPEYANVLAERDLLLVINPADITDRPVKTFFGNRYFKTTDHMSGFAYNTKLVSKQDLPKKYEDLLDPKWKGKLVITLRGGRIGHLGAFWGEEKLLTYAKALAAQRPIWVTRNTESMAKLASGEGHVGNASYNGVQGLKRRGAPLEYLFISPVPVLIRGLSIPKAAPHPNAAKLFLGWLLSSEGNEALEELGVGTVEPGTMAGDAAAAVKAELLFHTIESMKQEDEMDEKVSAIWKTLSQR